MIPGMKYRSLNDLHGDPSFKWHLKLPDGNKTSIDPYIMKVRLLVPIWVVIVMKDDPNKRHRLKNKITR